MGRAAETARSAMVTGGEGTYDEPLPALCRRTTFLESRRAWSRCRLSSRCSGVSAPRGGLDVADLDMVGGERLASEPYGPRSWPKSPLPESITAGR